MTHLRRLVHVILECLDNIMRASKWENGYNVYAR